MFYQSCTPGRPLGELVDRFWLCSDSPPHRRERILPSGTVELVVNLRQDEIRIYDEARADSCGRYSGAVVSGTYSKCFVIDPAQHASIIGVHFRPGGATPFLGLPTVELTDRHVDLETLWGPMGVELRERLCAATSAAERFSLLERILIARLRQPPNRSGAVPAALDLFRREFAQLRVRDVARRVGLSQRRFIQAFAAEVGLTPKLYSRVLRCQQARELAGGAQAPDWAQVAAACGYFDQSHLIHDFRSFTGFTPEEYLRRRSEHVMANHVPQTA